MIPAIPHAWENKSNTEARKTRVAAYCRVSTDTDEQETSYEAQIEHYTDYIQKHPGWVLAGIYADDGISGTNTKKREEFNRLINDCMNRKIDLVVTKSISRFARNTLDCLKYIRQLKEKNIPVIFEKENIDTMDPKSDVLLTIMASLAQQESQSLSQNVKLGLQYRYQKGKVQVNHNRFLGYTKDGEGNLVIDNEEAEVVKRIYREYLEGKSYYEIGKGLTADGIRTAAGSETWRASTLKKILQNEKYIGDALLQKTVTVDFLTKKRVVNSGISPQYYVENSHEAIIPRDIYMLVQEEMIRRSKIGSESGNRHVYSGKYALSSIVYCGHCGDIYRRTQWFLKGKNVPVWRCSGRMSRVKKDCPSRSILESDLHEAVVQAINRVIKEKDDFIPGLKAAVEKAIVSNNAMRVAEIDEKLEEVEKSLLEKTKEDCGAIMARINELRAEKQKLLLEDAANEDAKRKIIQTEEFLEKQKTKITEYDENLVRKLIEKVTVYDEKLVFAFRSGLEVEIV